MTPSVPSCTRYWWERHPGPLASRCSSWLSQSLSRCRRWLACRSIAPPFWRAVGRTESNGSTWLRSARKDWSTAWCEPQLQQEHPGFPSALVLPTHVGVSAGRGLRAAQLGLLCRSFFQNKPLGFKFLAETQKSSPKSEQI